MKYIIVVVCAVISLATATTIPDESQAETINYENTNDGTGNYKYSFYTSNGISRNEVGTLVNVGQKDEHIVIEGSYSYTDPTGKLILTFYTADENGYHIVKPETTVPGVGFSSPLPGSLVASLLG